MIWSTNQPLNVHKDHNFDCPKLTPARPFARNLRGPRAPIFNPFVKSAGKSAHVLPPQNPLESHFRAFLPPSSPFRAFLPPSSPRLPSPIVD
ncbi:hypothetical protein ACLOJK_033853 [Asimina triloba]